jgi:hypothetical protein
MKKSVFWTLQVGLSRALNCISDGTVPQSDRQLSPSPLTSRTRIRAIAAVIRAQMSWIASGVSKYHIVDMLRPLNYSDHRTRASHSCFGWVRRRLPPCGLAPRAQASYHVTVSRVRHIWWSPEGLPRWKPLSACASAPLPLRPPRVFVQFTGHRSRTL